MPRPTRLLTLLTAGAIAPMAHAETSPYYIGASQSFSYESNLLRVSDAQTVPEGFSKSDTISSTALLAGFDQSIGRQRVFGDAALRANRLANNQIYNNEGYSLSAGLDWETIEHLSGDVKLATNRNLARFNVQEVGLITQKNIETTEQADATLRVGGATEFSGELTYGYRSVDYSAIEYIRREFNQRSVSAGVRYRPSSASSFGLALRDTDGVYPQFRPLPGGGYAADRFERQTVDFTANLEPSDLSKFSARLSAGETRYEIATQRNFSGITGQAVWNWQPSAKLHFRTALLREPSQDAYFVDSGITDNAVEFSRISNVLAISTRYQASAKIDLTASLGLTHRSLIELAPGAGTETTGSDRTVRWSLGASWAPLSTVKVGCDIINVRRETGSTLSSNLHATTATCFGQFVLD